MMVGRKEVRGGSGVNVDVEAWKSGDGSGFSAGGGADDAILDDDDGGE